MALPPPVLLARSGHTVYATMRNPQRSPELGKLAQRENLPIIILPMDVDSDASVKTTIAGVLAQADHIDVLVNNAGIYRMGAVEELPFSAFQEVMETNYFGSGHHATQPAAGGGSQLGHSAHRARDHFGSLLCGRT